MEDGRQEERKGESTRLKEEIANESNGGACLCECINNAIKWAHLRTSHITAICLVVNLWEAEKGGSSSSRDMPSEKNDTVLPAIL